jgi:hypothetical protein
MVRASDAHAWVEYWDGAWIQADPTPQGGVQPKRVGSNWLDAVRFRWVRWVIEYSLDDQINIAIFARSAAPKIPRAMAQPKWLSLLIPAAVLAGAALWYIRRKRMSVYEKALSAIRRRGIKLNEDAEHETHLMQVREQWPEIAEAFEAYQKRYLSWRFGGRSMEISAITDEFIERLGAWKK